MCRVSSVECVVCRVMSTIRSIGCKGELGAWRKMENVTSMEICTRWEERKKSLEEKMKNKKRRRGKEMR